MMYTIQNRIGFSVATGLLSDAEVLGLRAQRFARSVPVNQITCDDPRELVVKLFDGLDQRGRSERLDGCAGLPCAHAGGGVLELTEQVVEAEVSFGKEDRVSAGVLLTRQPPLHVTGLRP